MQVNCIEHSFDQYYVLGNKVTAVTAKELQQYIAEVIERNGNELILNTNVFGINLACQLSWLSAFRNSASIVYCDGAGVVLGARLLGISLPRRITMADWIWDLAAFCEHEGFSLFSSRRRTRASRTLCSKAQGATFATSHRGNSSRLLCEGGPRE